MIRIVILLALFMIACNYDRDSSDSRSDYPSPNELQYKIGDCLYFKATDSTYGAVVVCGFSKDIAGIWYGSFYTAYDSSKIPTLQLIEDGKVMGRKIESAIATKGYITSLDGDYIIDTLFTNISLFTRFGNINLKDIDLGSHGAITSMEALKFTFQNGKRLRLNPPDHYSEHMKKLDNFHPEQYFEMKSFIR